MQLDFSFLSILRAFGLSVYFIFSAFIALYLPGRFILKKYTSSFSPFMQFVLFLAIGVVFWSLQGLLFGFLHMRFLTYGYLGMFLILSFSFIKSIPKSIKKNWKEYKNLSFSLILVFIVGMLGQLLQPGVCGIEFKGGWYCLVDDTVWHLGLTTGLVRHFPPFEPGMSGYLLKNYHFLANLFIAEFMRVFHTPLLPTQFIFSYGIISFLAGGLTYVIGKLYRFSKEGLLLAVFLQYFSSDIIYLITLVTRRIFEFTVHPLDDGMMMLENPPRAFSIVVALLTISLFTLYERNPVVPLGILTAVIAGSVIGFKVHTGFMVLCGFFGYGLYLLWTKQWKKVYVPLLTLLVSVGLYMPFNAGAGLPVYAPFEMSRMFAVQEKLELSMLELRRRVYVDHFNIPRIIQMDLIMFGIFLIAQFGLRCLGFFGWSTVKRSSVPLMVFLVMGLLGSFSVGTLFVQPVANADIFNFYLAGSLCLYILTIFLFDRWIGKMNIYVKIMFILLILVMSMPRWVYKMRYYLNRYDGLLPTVSSQEMKALEYLRKSSKPDDIVFVMNNQGQFDGWRAYVTAFSERDTFLSGRGYLTNQNINITNREKAVNTIFSSVDTEILKKTIEENKLKYLYYFNNFSSQDNLIGLPIMTFFQNDTVTIYRYENL